MDVANAERWQRSVNDDEEELDIAKQDEQMQMSEIEQCMRTLDAFKNQKTALKTALDQMDEDVAIVKLTSFQKWCIIDYQGPDLYAFIGFIGPADDDLNWLLILIFDY